MKQIFLMLGILVLTAVSVQAGIYPVTLVEGVFQYKGQFNICQYNGTVICEHNGINSTKTFNETISDARCSEFTVYWTESSECACGDKVHAYVNASILTGNISGVVDVCNVTSWHRNYAYLDDIYLTAPDTDKDGADDYIDKCPNTILGEVVDSIGCSCSQKKCNDQNPFTTDTCNYGTATCEFVKTYKGSICPPPEADLEKQGEVYVGCSYSNLVTGDLSLINMDSTDVGKTVVLELEGQTICRRITEVKDGLIAGGKWLKVANFANAEDSFAGGFVTKGTMKVYKDYTQNVPCPVTSIQGTAAFAIYDYPGVGIWGAIPFSSADDGRIVKIDFNNGINECRQITNFVSYGQWNAYWLRISGSPYEGIPDESVGALSIYSP